MPASFRAFFASLDVIIEEAVNDHVNTLRGAHVSWHEDHKNKPSSGCHTCLLLGMARQEQAAPVEAVAEPVEAE